MASDIRVPGVDEPTQSRVTAELDKATYDVEPRLVAGAECAPGYVGVKCPLCHRQCGVPLAKPYRCVCGALLVASK